MTIPPTLSPAGKPAVQSLTVIAGVVMFASSAAGLIGYEVSANDQAQLISLINSGYTVAVTVIGMLSSAAAIYGRIRATHQITSAVTTK